MTGTVFGKWYWSDWMSDPGVRASSYAARGLWMDLLCIAATADPTGYVVLNGRPLIASDIARLTGGDASEVEILLDELARNGVFTRDRHGRIYSRRMVREAKNAKISRENGRKGGNPTLRRQRDFSDRDNPPDKPPLKAGDNTHIPEARSHKAASAASARATRKRVVEAFRELAPQRLAPDTNRVEVWLAAGYDPELIVAVVREVLARKPDIGSLSYFDRRLAEAKSSGYAPRPKDDDSGEPRIDFGGGYVWPKSSVERAVTSWKKDPTQWPESALGPPPGSPGCRVPPEMLPASLH